MLTLNEFIKNVDEAAGKVKWDFVGLQKVDGTIMPLPAKSTFVTAIIEDLVANNLMKIFTDIGLTCVRGGDREYPDLTIYGDALGDEIIALDVKTCRLDGPTRISGFTLGSRAGYFKNPGKKARGCSRPYNDFTKHMVVGLIYEWNPTAPGKDMVLIKNTVVAEKWQLASKTTGTGTTHHIGSMKELDRILRKEGEFKSVDEFEEFWRAYDKRKKKS